MDDVCVQRLARKYDKDCAQILLRWSLQKGWVFRLDREAYGINQIKVSSIHIQICANRQVQYSQSHPQQPGGLRF